MQKGIVVCRESGKAWCEAKSKCVEETSLQEVRNVRHLLHDIGQKFVALFWAGCGHCQLSHLTIKTLTLVTSAVILAGGFT